jgi:WD40 repeat protein
MMNMKVAALMLVFSLPVAASSQSGRQVKTINLPAGVTVQYGTVSRAGTLVATIDSDNVVRVWSTLSGELLQRLADGGHPPTGVKFSADGRLLAVGYQIVANEKGVLRVFDVASWKAEHEFVLPFDVFALAFSPDNRRLALSGIAAHTHIWDLANSRSLADISPPFGGSASLSFSGDGRWVATADNDGYVRVYDANTGKLRSTVEGFLLEPFAVAFSQEGKFIVAGGADKRISIIDPETGKVLSTLPSQRDLIMSLDVSADGKRVAVIYGYADHALDVDHLALWDVDKGTILADLHKPEITIVGGAFVGDHYQFAAASGNQLGVWSLP